MRYTHETLPRRWFIRIKELRKKTWRYEWTLEDTDMRGIDNICLCRWRSGYSRTEQEAYSTAHKEAWRLDHPDYVPQKRVKKEPLENRQGEFEL